MTHLLAKAFEEAAKLPEALQDKVARQLLEDLDLVEPPTSSPADSLDAMADRALADFRAGRTREMGFDEL